MQPSLENISVPDDSAEIKSRVQKAWNLETRVLNYVSKTVLREFGDGPPRDTWRETLRAVLPAGKLRILDMGCGPGMFAQVCAELGHDATGMDFSRRMIMTAESLAAVRGLPCRFIYGDAEEPPLPPESFDVVLSRRLLFNLPHPERAFAAWRNLVVPGGLVISMDADPSALSTPVKAVRRWLGKGLAMVSGYQKAPPPYQLDPDTMQVSHDRFPLIKSPSAKVRPFMEQQGLVNIELIYTDKLEDIRATMEPFVERLLNPPSRPYILMGRRPK